MAQKQLLLPLVTALRLTIAMLERDIAALHARLLAQDSEHRHQTTIAQILAEADIAVPVPLTACTFDAEQGALLYEAPEGPDDAPAPVPHDACAPHHVR
jgi:hypothetical protein